MDTQITSTGQGYGEISENCKPRPIRVDPNYPLPSTLPPSQEIGASPTSNNMARATSRRRRATGTGSGRIPVDNFPQPPAPEVPKAPPISYRPPFATDTITQPRGNYPASFAERARALNENPPPAQKTEIDPGFPSQPVRPVRRGSLNRPIGGVYSEIQQYKRDSYPPPNGQISPQQYSNSTSPQEHQAQDPRPFGGSQSSKPGQQHTTKASPATQGGDRRPSVGLSQPSQKEWASDRSPLQKLEVKLSDISKEEKRARVQEAEKRLREVKERERLGRPGSEIDYTLAPNSPGQITPETEISRSRRRPDHSGEVQVPARKVASTANHPAPNVPRSKEAAHFSQSNSRKVSISPQTYDQRADETTTAGANFPIARNPSQKIPTGAARLSQPEQLHERGVRFQGDEDSEEMEESPSEFRNRRRRSGIEALARSDEARAARREKLRQDPSTMSNQSPSKKVPVEQQKLYGIKAETSRNVTSIATSRDAPDPVSRQAVKSHGQATKYEVPPQTAAGIQARQMVGFDAGPQGAVEPPAQRNHHLHNMWHRVHNHAVDNYEQCGTQPKLLDEWKRAGTARLTAAEFGEKGEPEKDQQAWWESSTESHRKAGRRRRISRDMKSLQDDNPNDKSKLKSILMRKAIRPTAPHMYLSQDRVIQTRPYVGEEDYERLSRVTGSYGEKKVSHLLHHLKHDHTLLSSAYSYSCPDLAIHNPSHVDHICEPYLSKELTLSMRSIRIRPAPSLATFDPPLYLKCGPLLRYTGMKRDRLQTRTRSGASSSVERETWRGSVMIVTADADSSYSPAPTLRLFYEPMDLLPPPTSHLDAENGHDLPTEYIDPVAGLPKLSRSGKTVYVKPVDDLDPGKDLSRIEDDEGLFEETRTAAVPTAYGTPDFRPGASSANPKAGRRDGRVSKKGQEVLGARLHAERGVTFWRFNLEVELGAEQTRIAYSINNCPSVGFWVPARGHSMNIMFHSCNGFSMSVNPNDFSGPDPLWRDVLNSHQTRPFHVMIGGGDQIYNDAVMSQSPLFREWLDIKNPHHKQEAAFSPSLCDELETFYLERYSMWFSQGLFGMANAQIPMINMWDDHDIIDGFGSYPHHFMSTPVFCGLGAVAFKYYLLFQHQSVPDEGPADEPSWLMGAAPGPYINELGRSLFVSLGKNVALLALDCRTERMKDSILSEASYELAFERCRREIVEGETKHLIVLLGVPIAYPRLVWLENLLTSRLMDPVKALGRTGLLGGFLNKFDGGVEILDDLDDHWTAKNHKRERNWFIQELQELAAEKSVRITILGGDVHLAAVGQFYSSPKLKISKDRDHRFMPNVVSSAIVNTPPPDSMADILNRRNKIHHLDRDTDENMIPMFTHDVNGDNRNNKRLLPRRNWCSIREYHPGSTPPPTPPESEPESFSDESPPPPTRLQRTLSLTRGDIKPGNLIRRLSGRGQAPPNGYPPSNRYDDNGPPSPESPENDGYFPRQTISLQRAATVSGNSDQRHSSAPLPNSSGPLPRPGNFMRRPTNMSEKAIAKGAMSDTAGMINLENGLDICLNCEVNQKDPAGITVPYRLLVPALRYEGHGDPNTNSFTRNKSLISRLTSIRGKRRNTVADGEDRQGHGQDQSRTPSDSEGEEEESSPPPPRRWSFGITQRREYRDQTPPIERDQNEKRLGLRKFEDRSQQIGQSQQQQPFAMPPRQQKQYREPSQQPTSPTDYERQDSVEYHHHLDASPPIQSPQNNGYPGRRPSKVDGMLGLGGVQRRNSAAANGGLQRGSPIDARGPSSPESNSEWPTYDGEAYHDEVDGRGEKDVGRGYSGIDAYREKKGWRKWLDKAKDFEARSSGRN